MNLQEEYLWDRLLKTFERRLSSGQRLDLTDYIRSRTKDWALLEAARKLDEGNLTLTEVRAGMARCRGTLDAAGYRESRATVPQVETLAVAREQGRSRLVPQEELERLREEIERLKWEEPLWRIAWERVKRWWRRWRS